MKKRILCLLLCLAMIVPLLPTVAFAKKDTVTISWYLDSKDAEPVASIEHPYGEPFSGPAEPARTGEYFLGWFYDKMWVEPFNRDNPVLEDISLYPLWVKPGREITAVPVFLSTTWSFEPGDSIHDFLYEYLYAETRSHCDIHRDPVLTNGSYYYDATDKKIVNDGTFQAGHSYELSAVLEPHDGYKLDVGATYYLQSGDDYYYGEVVSSNPIRVKFAINDANKAPTVNCAIYLDKDDTMMTAGWTIPVGTTVDGIAVPGRIDDYFGGWYKDKAFTQPFDRYERHYSDVNFYAKWIPKDYVTVSIYPDEYAYAPTSTVEIPRGTAYGRIDPPAGDSRKFGGWYIDRAFTEPYDPNAPLNASIDVIARWSREYPIELITLFGTYPYAGASAGSTAPKMTNSCGCTVQSSYWYDNYAEKKMADSDKFTGTGFYSLYVTFEPEFDYVLPAGSVPTAYLTIDDHTYRGNLVSQSSSDGQFTLEFPITPNNVAPTICLYAYLNPEIDQYSVQWYIPQGTCAYAPYEPTRDGYTFAGWYFDKACTEPFDPSRVLFEDTSLYARWEEIVVNFEDVTSKTDWSYAGIEYCVKRGLMNGISATRFNPKGTVTRAQLVTILYRMAGSPEVTYKDLFDDVGPGKWYSDPIIWAAENGIVNGVSDRVFKPNGNITREQIATILYRYVGSPDTEGSLEAFPDQATASNYARKALVWATRQGLINGIKSGGVNTLSPKSSATRAQIAAIIMRYDQA